MRYTVRITETLVKDLTIEAASEEEAIKKVGSVHQYVGIEVNEIDDVTITIPKLPPSEEIVHVDKWIDEAYATLLAVNETTYVG